MKRLFKYISILFANLLIVSCSSNSVKHYNPYNVDADEYANIYKGDKEDFYLHSWYEADADIIRIEEDFDTGLVKANYRKGVNYEYTYMYTSVCGPFADFTYINFFAKGTPGKSITFRVCYDEIDLEKSNVLGNDVSFSLGENYEIYTLKVKGTYKTRLDLVKRVCIFPEIGLSGSSIRDSFSFKSCWFSKEMPEGAKWVNEGVDTGDTTINVNGWRTQSWTFYTLYDKGNGLTGLTYNMAAEYAYIEKDIDINEDDNVLRFSFENILSVDDKLSVSHIVFKISGDVKEHIVDGVEYDYYTYYDSIPYIYDLTKSDEIMPDENNLITLNIPISSALSTIGNHHENGYRLTLLIESRVDDFDKFLFSRDGHMIIHDTYTLYQEDIVEELYSQFGENTYVLSNKDGVEKNVTYTNIRGNAYWPRLCRQIKTNVGDKIHVVLHNNLTSPVRIGLHAGILNDDRSDSEKNNMFFPLFQNNGKNSDGYFMDGSTFDINGEEDYELTISVDEDSQYGVDYQNDTINVIQFLIDNCYGDTTLRSGDIDIVKVEII